MTLMKRHPDGSRPPAGFQELDRNPTENLKSHPKQKKKVEWVPATPTQQATSVLLATLSTVLMALLVTVILVSPVQHYAAQNQLYQDVRLSLAEGSIPVGPLTNDGLLVEPGTPIAVFIAPDIGLDHEVIVEGTSSAQTMVGIGHRRDTALPCQEGASVLMARAAAYGGVGSQMAELQPGDRFRVAMGQATCTYEVIGPRRAGDDAPPAPTKGEGRLTLTTALGLPFMPTEVLRIDAALVGDAVDRPGGAIPAAALPESEAAMGTDPSALFGLVLLLEVVVAAAIGLTYLWRRWGRWQTWIVGVPVMGALGILSANSINQWILPNLL